MRTFCPPVFRCYLWLCFFVFTSYKTPPLYDYYHKYHTDTHNPQDPSSSGQQPAETLRYPVDMHLNTKTRARATLASLFKVSRELVYNGYRLTIQLADLNSFAIS